MPRRTGESATPAAYVTGSFLTGTPKKRAPVGVQEAQNLARALRDAIDETGTSISALSRESGVARSVIYEVIEGKAYASVLTLSRLERALGRQLWRGGADAPPS